MSKTPFLYRFRQAASTDQANEGRDEELDLINLSFVFSIILKFLLALESIAWCIVGTALNQVGENLFIQEKNFKALKPEEVKILLPEKRVEINEQTIP